MRRLAATLILGLALRGAVAQAGAPAEKSAAGAITQAHLLETIRELSSDAYMGRAPGTEGEARSVAYVIAQAKLIGLQPGNPDGSWTQTVKLWGMLPRGTLQLIAKGKETPLVAGTDYVAYSAQPKAQVDLPSAALVFVGYGVVAPEYTWDDYAGTDVRGKVVVILGGDPPVADPADPSKLDERMFLGKALTYYGRGGTKLETAYRHDAAGVILISAPPKATPFLFANYTREIMILRGAEERKRVQAQAVLSYDRAAEFFTATGADLEALRAAASKPGFHAVPIAGKAELHVTSKLREVDSANVIAKLTGSDPELKNEYVVYSGHWDHHGQVGDQIFHGASDNAAGTAGVLELARAFHSLKTAPRRTMLFLWPTAEEKGLLGAKWYVEHPLYPLAQTVADINLDYFSNWGWGRTRDFSIVGIGNSTLDDVTAEVVKGQGRVVTGDTAPEQGFYFRSDHWEFARVGVPSIETSPGIDYVGKPADFGTRVRADYIGRDYHQPSDEIKPGWDLSGAVEDLQVLFAVGYRVAQADGRPEWKVNAVWRPKVQ